MYMCVCIYIYIYIHTYIHTQTYTCIVKQVLVGVHSTRLERKCQTRAVSIERVSKVCPACLDDAASAGHLFRRC